MGVQGLWELLTPVGRRVSVDTLGSRKLAIDASIWIIQFMKAMRDDKGDMIRNAHLLGFFRRICKLLFLRVKPVFVFDGATPALKRRTVLARRRQREKAQFRIRKTAEKLLLNHLRTRKLEEITSEISQGPHAVKAKRYEGQTPVVDAESEGQNRSDAQFDQEATDALLAASLAAEYGEDLENGSKSARESVEGSDDEEEQLILPAVKGLDPSVLASLPPSMQLDLLVQMREQLVAENRQKFQKVSKVPSSFSQMQIQAYLKTLAFRREINEVQRAAAGGGIGGVPTARVASTTDREFIFSKSFEGEKPAPSEIEQQRSQQATPPKAVQAHLPKSLLKPSSVLFSSKSTQEKDDVAEGVVSLVSTELNEETDSNSNSIVHTYIDERGQVRVNRRRGMGVRMTRDLQWNLYLMKDVEARKSGVSVVTEPPIIPSFTVGNNDSQSISVVDQGLQISFVDDGISELSKDEDGDLFEELVMERGDTKDDRASATQGPSFANSRVDMVNLDAGNTNGEGEEEWEDGGVDESRDGSVVEDKDLAEAMRLSLLDQHPGFNNGDLSNQILLEDGPSSGESEVEWEDGTGDVSVAGLDVPSSNEEVSRVTLMPSEEAEFEEAIRRSLEDFGPPAKASSQLVIKEPAENSSNNAMHGLKVLSNHDSPSVRAEAESEELYLARERTRKGKAVLGGDEGVSLCTEATRPHLSISEQEQIAALTLSEMPVIEATMQAPSRLVENCLDRLETSICQGGIDFRSICIPTVVENQIVNSQAIALGSFLVEDNLVEVQETSLVTADPKEAEISKVDVSPLLGEVPEIYLHVDEPLGARDSEKVASTLSDHLKQTQCAPPPLGTEYKEAVLPCSVDEQLGSSDPIHASQSEPKVEEDQANIIREAEEMEIAKEREEQRREAALIAEREHLAREEAELQAELEVERQDIQAGLDKERELLAQEEMELCATQKKNERNAESVTGEMFAEVQELLQMFGLPYITAPMEAEAQCAYMDTIQLVDGVVTDDSDVFLFGGRTVYKNLFDDRKYVETYFMKDLESEMGMSREKLIRIAMLLGSDYTEGISGIGIVNAIEVVNAFPEEDGLQKFKEWLDSPDHSLFQNARAHAKSNGKGSGRGENTGVDELLDDDGVSEAGRFNECEGMKFTALQQVFMNKHRAVSKNWNMPDSFPSEAVVLAYINPAVDKSTETFTWGRPDLEALRRFCYERFVWNKEKADELLLPVLKEYDRRETQTRLESFYHFDQRFAKIRSRRIQKAVTGMTGKRSAELMELPPHLIKESPAKKSQNKIKVPKSSGVPLMNNEAANVSHNYHTANQDDSLPTVSTPFRGGGRGGRGRSSCGRRHQHKVDLQYVETLAGDVEDEEIVDEVSFKGRRGRSRGRDRGKGRGRGKCRAAKEESSVSDSSDNDDAMGESLGGIDSLKRKGEMEQPRRSTRKRSQVTYEVDNSDEEAGGTCSDGEEMFKVVDLLVAEASEKKPKGIASKELFDTVGTVSHGTGLRECSLWEETTFQTDMSGPLEVGEFGAGGGFCTSEDPGQQDREEQAFSVVGDGFCFPEGEDDPPANDVVQDNTQSRQSQAFEAGFCLSDEDAKELPGNERGIIEESACNNKPPGTSERLSSENSAGLGQSTFMVDTSFNVHLTRGASESSGVADLGLQAMPLMRRKRRKSS